MKMGPLRLDAAEIIRLLTLLLGTVDLPPDYVAGGTFFNYTYSHQ